jgi:DNA-binding response OmpR family regulator
MQLEVEVTKMMRILIALNEAGPRELIRVALSREDTVFETCSSITELGRLDGEESAFATTIVADRFPDGDALPLLRTLRERTIGPLVVVGAADDMAKQIAAYEAGADEVIDGPNDPVLLLTKIKAHLRRFEKQSAGAQDASALLKFDEFELDLVRRELRRTNGPAIGLSSNEFELLRVFANTPNTPLSRDALIAALRGRPLSGYERAVDMQVRRLRHKIEKDPRRPQLIKTIRGLGYLMAARVERC